jgi:hypothetical protein
MTSLLTLFFMVYGDATWYWYVAWGIFAFGSMMKTMREL